MYIFFLIIKNMPLFLWILFLLQKKRKWKDNSRIEWKMQTRNTALASAMHMSLLTTLGDKIFINEEIRLIWEMQVFYVGWFKEPIYHHPILC